MKQEKYKMQTRISDDPITVDEAGVINLVNAFAPVENEKKIDKADSNVSKPPHRWKQNLPGDHKRTAPWLNPVIIKDSC
jgi:hypothetical protein